MSNCVIYLSGPEQASPAPVFVWIEPSNGAGGYGEVLITTHLKKRYGISAGHGDILLLHSFVIPSERVTPKFITIAKSAKPDGAVGPGTRRILSFYRTCALLQESEDVALVEHFENWKA